VGIRAADEAGIEAAVGALRQGQLIGLPTETVYGLAADATDPAAVARIYAAKGRPQFNPLISHVPDLAAAETHGIFNAAALALAQAFWPGPLTLVVPRRPTSPVAELACAGLATIALRAPAHPVAQAVLRAFGNPLAAPSANLSGRLSPTTAADVVAELGDRIALALEGGAARVGLESSIVACVEGAPRLLRPGGVSREALEAVVGRLAAPGAGIEAPGMLASHYAPRAKLRLDAVSPLPGEAFLAFGPTAAAGALNLSPTGDLTEAAANLYAFLRRLDAQGPAMIAVAPIPYAGLGEAIRDRLVRAAAPRP
jgi:L-threonylcarbamoyladenylate synthase